MAVVEEDNAKMVCFLAFAFHSHSRSTMNKCYVHARIQQIVSENPLRLSNEKNNTK